MIENAKWIKSPLEIGESVPEFSKKFCLKGEVKKAELLITSIGVYEAFINGSRVGNYILAPGWTSYNYRLQYQQYDVTDMLTSQNEITVLVGNGWAVGRLVWPTTSHFWENEVKLLAVMSIEYANGEKEIIPTDDTWLCRESKIKMSELYDGETYDAMYESTEYANAKQVEHGYDMLIPQEGEQISEQDIIEPKDVFTTPAGELVIDFGQNMTGYPSFISEGKAGDVIEISFAEILDKDGNFYTDNYRSAQTKLKYICSGKVETYKPHLCFQGFRYIRLDQYPNKLTLEDAKRVFKAIVVHSDIERTGSFECSSPLINQLFKNIIWGQKGNFLDVPTDCPQRDERLGWTGDAEVFVRAASYNYNVKKFFEKWLRDVSADQRADGAIPHVVPKVLNEGDYASAAWADAAVICPWQIYLTYGDKAILEEHYEMMRKWIEYMHSAGDEEYLWLGGTHFGDWLGLDAVEGSYVGSTDKDLIASAYFAYSTSLFIKAGEAIGKDMSEYRILHKNVVKAYRERFMPDGQLTSDTQTAHAITLYFGLAENREAVAKRLAELIRENGNKLKTGFVGTPYLLHALSENGYNDLAYSLLLQEEYPSWLYSVKQGATTIWEHWDGMKPDGTMWSRDMNSFNHYAYGAVADWMYSVAAGIKTDECAPGFKNIILEPITDDRLSYVKASLKTAYGEIRSSWERVGNAVKYKFVIPESCTAKIKLGENLYSVNSGEYTYIV